MSESYPSWLPKRPPPPAPTSTFESSPAPHPRAADVFSSPGRKATPRSVRIIARDAPWREATGDSAETRVPSQPQRVSRASMLPPAPPPRPRFKAPSLHLSLLRSPALSMRIQYMLLWLSTFAHLFVQGYFDLNTVYMLIQVSSHPGPNNSSRNWSLAAVAYAACFVLQLFGVFFLYEVVYSFYRRWRVKRPLMLPLYFSAPAHNLVSLTSYTNFCFFTYIRRSARPSWSSISSLFRPSSPSALSSNPVESPSPSPPQSHSSDSSSTIGAFSDYIAEWCFWRSQNVPTVILLLPRAALCLSLLLTSSRATGRDRTFFDTDGALSGYARGMLLANVAWTAWRALVLLGSILGLWILSGTACAGLCGPRYRWEEERDQGFDQWEKRASYKPPALTYSYASDDDAQGISDGWSWKQGTRERVREAWELCLTNVRPGRGYPTANVRAREKEHEEEFAGLDEVLAAAGFAAPRFPAQAQRSVLSSEFFVPAEGREALSDIIPPADEAPGATDAYGSQRSRRSDPLRVLPYPFKEFQSVKPGESSGAEKGKEKEVAEAGLIPFPSPVPSPEEEDPEEGEEEVEEEEEDEEEEEGDEDEEGEEDEGEEDFDEEDIVEGRRTSGSMSSLGQPVASGYPFAFHRPARRSSASASHGTPSHRTPQSTSTSPSQSNSTPSTRGSRSTPSTRGSRVSRSTLSNRESSDSPRSPASADSPVKPFIPPPPRNPRRRRRRAGTAPSLPSSPIPLPGPSHIGARVRMRTRTISASNSSSSRSRGLDPEPEALYESDEAAGRVPSPVADGSQEEAEKEDSVGLLSAAPSPNASLAGIRQRASNLSHRRGNGSRSSSSGSPAGSQGRSGGSLSGGSARSRAQSLIHSLGQRASLGEFGIGVRSRSRSSSVVRNDDSQYSDSPRSAATGSGSNRISGSGSASGTGSGRPSGEGPPGIEHTFGRPGELLSHREHLERLEAADAGPLEPSAQPAPAAGTSTGLRHAASELSGIAPSEATERLRVPPSEMDQSRTDISTANQSFVTAPMTIESTTTESGDGHSTSTWAQGLRHHVPRGTWGHEPV